MISCPGHVTLCPARVIVCNRRCQRTCGDAGVEREGVVRDGVRVGGEVRDRVRVGGEVRDGGRVGGEVACESVGREEVGGEVLMASVGSHVTRTAHHLSVVYQ